MLKNKAFEAKHYKLKQLLEDWNMTSGDMGKIDYGSHQERVDGVTAISRDRC